MREAGEFTREVINRVPEDVDYDCVELACGHHTSLYSGHVNVNSMNCYGCIKDWINRHKD
jgi:hypothetical protein